MRPLIRPDASVLEDLNGDAQMAVLYLLDAWAEIDRLREQHDALIEYDAERRAALAVVSIEDAFDPRGHFVYTLYDGEDRIIYIGRSSNVFSRLGAHLTGPMIAHVRRASLIRCADYHDSMRLEMEMIRQYRPIYNVVGNRAS